ncbi:NADH-quinone oxidoreductase subunit N [Gracilimonas sp. Q87]|uniref:NADH-quinone oxidoreductase subunit N n=1 Tax=Gracilimonas sp. Q87 TaxID=3384766 RepID=UPI0039840443
MIEHTLHSLSQFLPEIVIVITLCVIIVADLVTKKDRNITGYLFLGGLVVSGFLVLQQIGLNELFFYDMVVVDPFAVYFKVMIVLTGILITFFSLQSRELADYRSRIGEFYMLLSGMILGMMLMVSSTNILMMYLAFELTSISSYVLVGFTKKIPISAEASMKYIVYGSVSSGVMLYGLSLLIGLTGGTDIFVVNEALSAGVSNPLILNISILMILVGMGFKIAVVPFHFWAPDVYEGAPISIAAILAVASKIAAFGLLLRFFTVSFSDPNGMLGEGIWQMIEGVQWTWIVSTMAALAMIVGNLTALKQDNIKRMLAYSSIAHAGYLLMGVVMLAEEGIASIMIYLFIYIFMNLGAFYVAMLFSNKLETESIEQYKGLGFRAPLESVGMTIFLIALTGIPPTGGFVAKLYIFGAAVSGGWFWLVAIAGITTVISLFYYIRVVRNLFFYRPSKETSPISFSIGAKVFLFVLLIPTILLGIYFEPLLSFAKESVQMFGM